jgi:hypothetical protein
MEESKQITVIVPVHKFDEEVKALLTRAVESVDVECCDLLFVGPNDVLLALKDTYKEATFIKNEDTDVFTQINKAALQCVTPYFTVLEFDDVLLPNWKTTLVNEIQGNTVTIPLNEFVEDGSFRAFGNEIAWDAAFIHEEGEIGYITEEELKLFNNFNITGAIIKTEDFISIGYLKPEFKIFTWYEFLMRVARAGKTTYVVPRVCYSHTVLRNGSYMTEMESSLEKEEVQELLKKVLGE